MTIINKLIELIETLWNVNHSERTYNEKIYAELIETLWNVNKQSSVPENLQVEN